MTNKPKNFYLVSIAYSPTTDYSKICHYDVTKASSVIEMDLRRNKNRGDIVSITLFSFDDFGHRSSRDVSLDEIYRIEIERLQKELDGLTTPTPSL